MESFDKQDALASLHEVATSWNASGDDVGTVLLALDRCKGAQLSQGTTAALCDLRGTLQKVGAELTEGQVKSGAMDKIGQALESLAAFREVQMMDADNGMLPAPDECKAFIELARAMSEVMMAKADFTKATEQHLDLATQAKSCTHFLAKKDAALKHTSCLSAEFVDKLPNHYHKLKQRVLDEAEEQEDWQRTTVGGLQERLHDDLKMKVEHLKK
eukprot:8479919-Lingulodinium_polyedra.AAC.1